MKKLFSTLAVVLAAFAANAEIEAIQIPIGSSHKTPVPGKVVQIQVLSGTADGTATVKSVQRLVVNVEDVATTYATNTTYSLVYSNGTEVVTNTVDVDYSPFPANMDYISYTTNETVVATSVTNLVPTVSLVATNAVGPTVTCSAGYGSADPEGVYLVPGCTVFAEGSADGRVTLIIER